MTDLKTKLLPEEDFTIVNECDPAPDMPYVGVGERARYIDGGQEMVVISRYYAGSLNGERAIVRWSDSRGETSELDFYAGNLRRIH